MPAKDMKVARGPLAIPCLGAALGLMSLVSCSGTDDTGGINVSGMVRLNDQPLAHGVITFLHNGSQAISTTVDQGRYAFSDANQARPGSHRVILFQTEILKTVDQQMSDRQGQSLTDASRDKGTGHDLKSWEETIVIPEGPTYRQDFYLRDP